jgi:predicted nucleotidyltransferase
MSNIVESTPREVVAPTNSKQSMTGQQADGIGRIIELCKRVLKEYYGSQFEGLLLYGSMARNQASRGSDIDLLVLLDQPFDYFEELHQIVEMLYPVQLESEWLISAKPAAVREYERGRIQLYRNAKKEGVLV